MTGSILTPNAYLRSDGRKGIRNIVSIVYLVECAHHVAQEIQLPFREQGVHLLGFSGCYPKEYSFRMLRSLCTHPNVGAVLLVSLGCEGFNRRGLLEAIRVNCLIPSEVITPLYERWLDQAPDPAAAREQLKKTIPLERRTTTVQEIADTVAFLASPKSSHTTGQLVYVDGGYVHLDRACTQDTSHLKSS